MGFACAIQMTGLVRGESKGKHRSNGKAILAEMGKERFSASETLDKTRTHLNHYWQKNHSGFAAWDDMERRANAYKQPVKGKTRSGEVITRFKSLRKDAVIGVAIIINPPYELCSDWDEQTYSNFYGDSMDCLADFKPEIFRRSNQVFCVDHRDEGYDDNDNHLHAVYDCITEDGRYCGNELDAKFLSDFNKVYPEMMRRRGWKMMDNLDVTDWNRYSADKSYKASRDKKRRTQGKSVNQHIRNKINANLKESKDVLERSRKLKADYDKQLTEIIASARERLHKDFELWKWDVDNFCNRINETIKQTYEDKYRDALKQYSQIVSRKLFDDYKKIIDEMQVGNFSVYGVPVFEYFKRQAGVDLQPPVEEPPVPQNIPKVKEFRPVPDFHLREDTEQDSDDFEF